MKIKEYNPKYTIVFTYHGFDMNFDRHLEKSAGRSRDGSGYGFGLRDLSFGYFQYPAAKRAWNKLRKFKKYNSEMISRCEMCGQGSEKLQRYCSKECEKDYNEEMNWNL